MAELITNAQDAHHSLVNSYLEKFGHGFGFYYLRSKQDLLQLCLEGWSSNYGM
jgi:hypothetical protein